MNTSLILSLLSAFISRTRIVDDFDLAEMAGGTGRAPAEDDFDRDVYCLLGLPVDAVDMAGALRHVRAAAALGRRCFLSTPNLNFLVASQADPAFRCSVVHSDLSLVDGMPVAWMARRLGIPVRKRVTGSGLFEALWQGADAPGERLPVYFFGGPDGAAKAASDAMNADSQGLRCVGYQSPGFGSVEELSGEASIAHINTSGAAFLVVSLGARKGQAWIVRNRARLAVPVISHLGAVVNFAAGTVSRAPAWMQSAGLEWLWRIKEEPKLWRRYWHDGVGMLRLLATRLLPHLVWLHLHRGLWRGQEDASATLSLGVANSRIALAGAIPNAVPDAVRQVLRAAARRGMDVVVDCSRCGYLSPGLFGLLLMLRKHQAAAGKSLKFVGLSPALKRLFRWNGVDYLLADAPAGAAQPAFGQAAGPESGQELARATCL